MIDKLHVRLPRTARAKTAETPADDHVRCPRIATLKEILRLCLFRWKTQEQWGDGALAHDLDIRHQCIFERGHDHDRHQCICGASCEVTK